MTTTGGPSRLRRAVALGCATTLVGAGAVLLAAPAAADDLQTNDNRYSLSAEGDGMYFTLYDGSLPATPNVDASPYSAQTAINSQGSSTAFAGLPYLGKTAETLPGTVNGLSGGNFPPIPPFPGYVATTYPGHKSETQSQGPYLVQADSQQYSSTASAGTGVSGDNGTNHQQVFSTANVVAANDGTTVAHATAGVDGLHFGPIDALNVSSDLTIASDGKAAPKVTENENLGSFTFLQFKIGITREGFVVLGASVPTPAQTVLANLNAALGASGMQISVLPGSSTTDKRTGALTVTSGSVKLTSVQDVPTQGTTLVTYTFGRSVVSSVNVAAPSFDDSSGGSTGSDSSTGASTGSSTGSSTGTDSGATSGSASGDGGGSGLALNPGTVGTVGPPPGTVDAAPPPVLDSSGSTGTTGGVATTPVVPRTLGFLPATAPKGTETWSLYLVLVLAGAAVLGGQQVVRFLGVRLM
ncbi:MAG: hypothetical protein ACXVGD_20895, partial [Blastococcus sp.]